MLSNYCVISYENGPQSDFIHPAAGVPAWRLLSAQEALLSM